MLLPLLLLAVPAQEGPSKEALETITSRELARVAWETEWAPAAARAEEDGKLVLVLFTQFPPPDLADELALGPFLDLDVVDMIEQHYVPLRWSPTKDAPFKDPDVFGMGKFAFGTSVLVTDGGGAVLDETFSFERTSLFEFLARVALDHRAPEGSPTRALASARRGDDADALGLLPEEGWQPEDVRFLMRVAARHRRGARMLEIAEAARAAGLDAAETAQMEGLALLRMGRTEDAETKLDQVPADHTTAPYAWLHRAEIHIQRGEVAEAVSLATRVVEQHPDSRAAASAALVLRSRAQLGAAKGRSLTWPNEKGLEILRPFRFERRTITNLAAETREAMAYLVRTQRPDGSWPNGFEVLSGSDPVRFPLTVATTALCARALIPGALSGETREAFEAALRFLREARDATEAEGDARTGFDYAVWTKASVLLLMHAAVEAGAVDLDDWRETLPNVVAELGSLQKPGGGWLYYPTPNDLSFSFVTAYVLHGLHAAQQLGLDVPAELLDPALASMERARVGDTIFQYMVPGNAPAQEDGTDSGAAGRSPLCMLALHRFGKADAADLRRALDHFLRHRGLYAREHGKTVMHCGPEAEGSHYLMFDYLYVAEALLALPEEDREPYRSAILDQVRNARLSTGAYLDNPITTDRYGAAMAGWILHRLGR